jgi:Tir chaperone protein (CesT) family
MKHIMIKLQRDEELARFLESNGFVVEELSDNVLSAQREDELPVFLNVDDKQIYFEVDLGNVDSIITQDLLLSLLALNTEILPVSVGLDTSNPADHRLVLVESRETGDLSDQELLAVFDALELAVDRVTEILTPSFNS